MKIRQATEADIPTVAEMWLEAAAWLRERGYDQWQYPIKMHNIEAAVSARTCWLVEDDQSTAVATVTLDSTPDLSLWLPEDDPFDALYLHRLVVRLANRSNALGSAIIDWAGRTAHGVGKPWIRLDAWTQNVDLHNYYKKLGFHPVRIIPQVASGALFQRPSRLSFDLGPLLNQQ